MTATGNLFSHIENLETGSLVLDDPFTVPPRQGSVCRYALHRQDGSVLAPDPEKRGLAAWHRLLPPVLDGELPETPILWEGPDHEGAESLCFPASLARQTADLYGENAPGTELGTWSNPFRVEAYKALGLEIAARYPDPPTLILTDTTGELLLGLALAGQHHTLFHPKPAYRLILIQYRPYHQLCQAFEGAKPDWHSLDFGQPPSRVPDILAEALVSHLGTAIALDSEEANLGLFKVALEKLRRTGFVDDEDQVLLLNPSKDQPHA